MFSRRMTHSSLKTRKAATLRLNLSDSVRRISCSKWNGTFQKKQRHSSRRKAAEAEVYDRWPVSVQCKVFGVTRSAYYKFAGRPTTTTELRRGDLLREIQNVHQRPKRDRYGSPRIHRELTDQGIKCSRNTVAKLMRQAIIRAKRAKTFRVCTTDSRQTQPVTPNRLDQQFSVSNINRIWLTDITYIPTREGFSYLYTVQDLYSRRTAG
jgi:putative transposase